MPGFELERRQQVILLLFLGALVFSAGVWYARHFWNERPPVAAVDSAAVSSQDSSGVPGKNQATENKMLYVHVVGAVQNPGVYQLPAGARLFNALELASPSPEADLALLNLAAPLADGQQIYVPRQGENLAGRAGVSGSSASRGGTASAGAGSAAAAAGGSLFAAGLGSANGSGLVNLNTASEKELDEKLPGIGPALAKRIVEYREQHGGFRSPEELKNVSGIGEKRYEQIKDLVTVY